MYCTVQLYCQALRLSRFTSHKKQVRGDTSLSCGISWLASGLDQAKTFYRSRYLKAEQPDYSSQVYELSAAVVKSKHGEYS